MIHTNKAKMYFYPIRASFKTLCVILISFTNVWLKNKEIKKKERITVMADDLKSLDSCSCKTEDWLPGARTKTLPITPPGPTGVPHWSASREDADATVGRRLKNNQA